MAKTSQRATLQAFSHLQLRTRANALLTSTALIPVATALALIPTEAFAQDATWDGETNIDWAEATNWDSNSVPGAGSTVTIDNGALPDQPTISFGDSFTVTQTNVSAGLLTISGNLISPITLSGTGLVTINAGGDVTGLISVGEGTALQLNGSLGAGAPLTLNGSGIANGGALRNLSGDNSVGGAITLGSGSTLLTDAGVLRINNTVDNGGNLLTSNNALGSFTSISGVISGVGGFAKTGAGQTDLTGINTFTGSVTLTDGALALNGGAALADSVDVTVNGGIFATFNNETIGSLAGTGGVVRAIGSTLTVGANNTSTTYGGSIIDNGADVTSLAKTGTGTLTLTGANTYSGSTTVLSGALVNSGTITGSVTNNATFTSTGSLLGGLTNNTGAIANLAGTVDGAVFNSGTFTVAGDLASNNGNFSNSDAGVLNVSGGNFTGLNVINNNSAALNGINVGSGRTLSASVITNSATASILNAGTITASNRINYRGTLTTTGTINAGIFGLRGLAGSTINASGAINGAVSNAGTFNVTGDLVNDNAITNTGTLNLTGATLTTSGLLNNAGGTTNAAGTLNGSVQNSGTFNITGNLNNSNDTSFLNFDDGVLNVSDGDYTGLVVVTNLSTAANGIDVGAGRTLSAQIITNGSDSSILNAGTITTTNRLENNGSLISTGTINGIFLNNAGGSATLQGAVNGTLSNSGTVTLTAGLNVTGAVTQTSMGNINLAGFIASFGSLAGSGSVSLGAGTLTVGGDGTSTSFDGVISGDGGLVKTGTGTFALTGANTYLGETRVDEGSLMLTATGIIAGRVRNSATFTNAGTVSGQVVNLGNLTSTGTVEGGLTQFAGATATVSGVLNGSISNAGALNVNGNLTSNDFAQTSGTGTTQILEGARWSGLTGFTNASTDAMGLSIAGTLDISGILANQTGASTIIGTNGDLTAANIANSGTVTNNGTVNTDITNSGTITNNGTWNGGLSQGTGSATNASLWNGFFLIDAGGAVTNNGVWDNSTAFFSAVNDGLFENFGSVSGLGVMVTSADALLVNRAGGIITLATGEFLRASGGGTISNAGAITANAEANAGGIISNLTGSSWTGAITVAATGSLSNAGTITGTVTNSGTFSNAGRIIGGLTNDGSVQLSGQIDGAVTNNASITSFASAVILGRFTQSVDGSLNLAGFNNALGSLAGEGAIALGTGFLTVGSDNTSSTFAGVISGEGGLVKAGDGIFTLTAINTYTGTTFVEAGTLVIGEGEMMVLPPVQNSSQAAVQAVLVSAPESARGMLAPGGAELAGGPTAGTLTRGTGAEAVTFAALTPGTDGEAAPLAALNAMLSSAVIAGNVVNNAGLINNGTILGQLVNNADATAINHGVIEGAVFNEGTLTSTGTIGGGLMNNGTAQIEGALDGDVFNTGTITLTGTTTGIDIFEQTATGVFDLAGFDTAVGAITGAGSITLGDATLTTGTDGVGTVFSGGISGSGALIKVGTGRLVLTGTNTYSGGTTISGGVLQLGDGGAGGSIIGPVLNNGALVINRSDAVTFANVISGNGALIKVGTGRLVLTGTNTYSGGTTISSGVLQLGDGGAGGSIIGPVLNNGALVINRSDAVTFANVISGSGMFVQDGAGTTTLTGANTYSGGTLISRGRLIGDTMSLLGQIQNDAALEFAQGTAGIFAGQLFGTGLFDKTGAGLLELTGNNNGFTGGTFVRAGELRVTGGLAGSQVTVLSGATLSGAGTIGGLTATSGSVIAPGASGAGTLGVNGAVNLLPGSTVQLDIRAGGPSDMIVSNGAAAVGGTAAFTNLGGVYAFNSEVLLLQADSGRTGTFDSATGFAGFGILYRPELVYTGTQVLLRFAPNLLTSIVGNSALTANQRSVVNGIDAAVTAGYNPQPLFAIFSLPTAEQASAFDQISGEVYATAAGVGFEQERLLREAVLGRVNAVAMAARETPEAGKGAGAWAQLFGGWGHGDGDGNASRFEADRMGFATGIDFGNANENGSWRAGVFGMQIQSDVTIDRLGSRAEVEQTGGGVYASVSSGGFTAAMGGYLTEVDFRAFRNIDLPGFAEDNVGTTEGTGRQAFAELSYTFEAGQSMVRPFVGGAIGSFKLDGLTETGGAAALDVAAQSYSTGSVTAGVDGVVQVGKRLTLGGTLAGRAQLGDRAPQAQLALAAAPNQVFGVSGVQLDEVALAARFDATVALEKNLTFSVGYTGLIGSTISDHGARATLQVQF